MGLSGGAAIQSNLFLPQAAPQFNAAQALQSQLVEQNAQAQELQAQNVMADAELDAAQLAREAAQFREDQALAYDNSGVLLAGSPLLVLESTRSLAQQEIDAVSKRALNQAKLYQVQAGIIRNEGRAQLLGASTTYNTKQAQERIAAGQKPITSSPLLEALGSVASGIAGIAPGLIKRGRAKIPKLGGSVGGGSANPNNAPNLGYIHGPLGT